jgi:hypothetical protein
LMADLDVRIITQDGELLHHFTLNPAKEDPQSEDARRSTRRTPSLGSGWCCEHPLNPGTCTISNWRLEPQAFHCIRGPT